MTPEQKLAIAHMAAGVVILQADTEEEVVALLASEEETGKAPKSFFKSIGDILTDTYNKPEYTTIVHKWVEDNDGSFAPEDGEMNLQDFVGEA